MDKLRLVTQHNAFITSKLRFKPLEQKIFIKLLADIKKDDTELRLVTIDINELIGGEIIYSSTIKQLEEVAKELVKKSINISTLDLSNNKKPTGQFEARNFISRCKIDADEETILAKFNEDVKEYVLDLNGYFSQAELRYLLKCHSFYSLRLYWMFKEHSNQKTYLFTIEELREALLIEPGQYTKNSDFTRRVIKQMQKELKKTDCAFDYKYKRRKRVPYAIEFTLLNNNPVEEGEAEGILELLSSIGINKLSVNSILSAIKDGFYDEGFVRYIVDLYEKKEKEGGIKKSIADAVFSAVFNNYEKMLLQYQKHLKNQEKVKKKSTTTEYSANERYQKLLKSLEEYNILEKDVVQYLENGVTLYEILTVTTGIKKSQRYQIKEDRRVAILQELGRHVKRKAS